MLSIPALTAVVEQFDPDGDDRASRSRLLTLALLRNGTAALDRQNYAPGHLTASGIVISGEHPAVLLVYHRRLERWLQPGGHVEPSDASAVDAAAREVLEETGVSPECAWEPLLVGVDVHEIPARADEPAHLHHDLVWRFRASSSALEPTSEGNASVWCGIPDLPRYAVDHPLMHAVRRAVAANWVRRGSQSVE